MFVRPASVPGSSPPSRTAPPDSAPVPRTPEAGGAPSRLRGAACRLAAFGAFLAAALLGPALLDDAARGPRVAAVAGEPAAGVGSGSAGNGPLSSPPLGNLRYRASIAEQRLGEEDADDYAQDVVAGETLDVLVTALPGVSSGASLRERGATLRGPGADRVAAGPVLPLRPLLVLVDPDGVLRFAEVRSDEALTTTSLRGFVFDKTGRWTARISGRDGTRGPYEVRFRLRPPPVVRLRRQRLGGDVPPFRVHPFGGVEGALLSADLRYDARQLPVELRSLSGPSGAEVLVDGEPAVDRVEAKGRSLRLRDVPLSGGSGPYALRVRTPIGTARYDLTLRVTPPPRPTSKRPVPLVDREPWFEGRTNPIPGDAGLEFTLTGEGFATGPFPRVFFGTEEAEVRSVSADGRTLVVVVPPRNGPGVVALTVRNPDGQGVCRANFFTYVPAPVFGDLLDASTRSAVRAGSTAGGRALVLTGENLFDGYRLSLGSGQPVLLSGVTITGTTANGTTNEARFTLPVSQAGTFTPTISDAFGRSDAPGFQFLYKVPPVLAARPFDPAALKQFTAVAVTVTGTGFEPDDVVRVNGTVVAHTFLTPGRISVPVPALLAGSYAFSITDRIGTVATGPTLDVKLPPSLNAATPVAGSSIGREVPFAGGTQVRVDGANFLASDVVELRSPGGSQVVTEILTRTPTSFTFVVPAGSNGLLDLVVTDGAGQVASLLSVLRRSGFRDVSASLVPGPGAVDDLGASVAAVGDVDRDGRSDDVLLGSVYVYGTSAPGTRSEHTRLLAGQGDGTLFDATGTVLPAARSDAYAVDVFDASALAIGDLDRANGPDLVVAGIGARYSYYAPPNAPEVRILRGGANGIFTYDELVSPPRPYAVGVYAYYGYYAYLVKSQLQHPAPPVKVLVGDLDRDGDQDLVLGHVQYDQRFFGISPTLVNYANSPPTLAAPPGAYSVYAKYYPAVRILENRLGTGGGFADVSASKLPGAGDNKPGNVPLQPSALHARDALLGDLDRDGDLDLVVTTDNPYGVTAYGYYALNYNKYAYPGYALPLPAPRTATEVLLNDGAGKFSSATSTWMPPGGNHERYHGNRLALADLDADGDLDLVILLDKGVDEWLGTKKRLFPALRVLRNDGTRFRDVTATAVPPVDTATGDDWRGTALAVKDVNQDGIPDLLVSTLDTLQTESGVRRRSLRLLAGGSGLRFSDATGFLPVLAADSGEAEALLFVPDLGGSGKSPLLLTGENAPSIRNDARRTRVYEWIR